MSQACLSAICHPLNTADMAKWVLVAEMNNVLRPGPQPLLNMGFKNGGEVCADDVRLPNTDCRLVGAVVLHECAGVPEDAILWISETPSVRQDGNDTIICVTGFRLDDAATETPDRTELSIYKGQCPCEKAEVMECCLDLLLCGMNKVEVSFNGRMTIFGQGNIAGLKVRIAQLQAQCELETGKRAPSIRSSGIFRCELPTYRAQWARKCGLAD